MLSVQYPTSRNRRNEMRRGHVFSKNCLLLALTCGSLLSAAESIPFKGLDMGTFTTSAPNAQQVVRTEDSAAGEATHLGRYKLSAHEFISLVTLDVTGGSFTITAANGDTLAGTYSGKASTTDTPTIIRYEVSGPITSGTGRFSGLTGTIAFFGIADLQAGRLSESFLAMRTSNGEEEEH
jgi:hypothetical protein